MDEHSGKPPLSCIQASQPESPALIQLKDHQKEVQQWLRDVKRKIYEIETSYLEGTVVDQLMNCCRYRSLMTATVTVIWSSTNLILIETQLGNIVRGWEIDGKVPNPKQRGHHDDKERLFSFSSYEMWLDHRKGSSSASSAIAGHDNSTASRLPSSHPHHSEKTRGPSGSTGRARKNKKRKADLVEEWDQPGDY